MRQSSVNCKEDVLRADELIKAGTPLVCFDLETTGTSTVSDRAVSISAIKVALKGGIPEETERLDLLLNPGFSIPKEASEINHIYDEDVADAPTEDEAFRKIKMFFGEKPFVCGYNSKNFDAGFMNAIYGRQGETFTPILHVDVYEMAKEKLDMKSYKLENVAHELGTDAGLEFHNSIDDCLATYRCFNMLLQDYIVPDEEAAQKMKVTPKEIGYWKGPSYSLERIYIKTTPYTKTFYDIYKKEWRSESDIDLLALKAEVLKMFNVKNEAELVRYAKNANN